MVEFASLFFGGLGVILGAFSVWMGAWGIHAARQAKIAARSVGDAVAETEQRILHRFAMPELLVELVKAKRRLQKSGAGDGSPDALEAAQECVQIVKELERIEPDLAPEVEKVRAAANLFLNDKNDDNLYKLIYLSAGLVKALELKIGVLKEVKP